jgi:hypothetical protein
MDQCVDACPACAESKKWRRIETAEFDLQDFRRTNAGVVLPGVQDESGRCISLWVLASRSANCLRVNFLRKKRAFFGQLRESVVGNSLKFFERGFLQRAVQLLNANAETHQLTP